MCVLYYVTVIPKIFKSDNALLTIHCFLDLTLGVPTQGAWVVKDGLGGEASVCESKETVRNLCVHVLSEEKTNRLLQIHICLERP